MRIVTTGAIHFAFPHGHMGSAEHLGPFVPMTLETGFFGVLGDEKPAFALLLHHIVAIRTTDARRFMRTAAPMHAQSAFMTLKANGVPGFCGNILEGNYRFDLFGEVFRCHLQFHMLAQRTMADFAGSRHFQSEFCLVGTGVFCFQERFYIIQVTVQAFLGIADRGGSLQVGIDLRPIHLPPS